MVSSSVFAQTIPLETYIYGQSQAAAPYASGLRIPVAPNTSPFSLQYIPANSFSTISGNNTFIGFNSFGGVLRINNASSGSIATGNASVLITPSFGGSGASEQTIGTLVVPAAGAMTDTGAFNAAFNVTWGTASNPVPAGKKGQLSDYECTVQSKQAAADQTDFSHCLGGTAVALGTGPLDGVDLAMHWAGGNGNGLNISVVNTVTGGAQFGAYVHSFGSAAHPIAANFRSDNGGGATQDFSSQGQSAAAENDSFSGLIGAGDSALTNPFVIVGNNGSGSGVVGTYSNHPLQFLENAAPIADYGHTTAGKWTFPTGVMFALQSGTPVTYACFTSSGLLISSATPC